MSDEERAKYEARINFKPSDDSVHRMNEKIIADINSTIVNPEEDHLYILGDFCYPDREIRNRPKKYVERVSYWRYRINCKNVYLIWGNHDAKSWNDDSRRKMIEEQQIFSGTYDLKTIMIEGQCIVLCHYALATWEQQNCKWRAPFWNLYGHSHGTAENGLDASLPGRRSIDVGIDNIYQLFGNYKPLSFFQLRDIMAARPGHRIDHHAKIKNEKWLGKDHSQSEEDV